MTDQGEQWVPPVGIGGLVTLAFAVVMGPGIVAYAVLRLVGLGIGAAGVLALLIMILMMGVYPVVLRRLGWVPPKAASR